MTDDNITQLYAGDGPLSAPMPKDPEPWTYEVHLKDRQSPITESGYLALGAYVAILGKPNDVQDIKFATETGNVLFVYRTDEVVDDE